MKYAEWIVVLVFAGLLTAAGVSVRHAYVKAGKYEQAVKDRDTVIKGHLDYIRLHDEQNRKRDAASQGYHDEVTRLQNLAATRPVPVVRLCPSPRANVPAPAEVAGRLEAAAPAGSVLPAGNDAHTEQGPDIGPDLTALARRCDDVSAQLRAVLKLEGE